MVATIIVIEVMVGIWVMNTEMPMVVMTSSDDVTRSSKKNEVMVMIALKITVIDIIKEVMVEGLETQMVVIITTDDNLEGIIRIVVEVNFEMIEIKPETLVEAITSIRINSTR